MKGIFIFGIIAIVFFAGCYKEKLPKKAADIIVSHTWYLKVKSAGGTISTAACDLSEQLTFKKDSTGNHYYAITCDTSQPANMSFDWILEATNYHAQTWYENNIGGVKGKDYVWLVGQLDDDTFRVEGSKAGTGSYIYIYTSKK